MKFQLAAAEGYTIQRVETDAVIVNGERLTAPFLLFPDAGTQTWPGIPAAQEHVEERWSAVVAYAPAIVLIGTGKTLKFPHPSLLRPLIDARIGYEVMATDAACRTYNVLLSEGRKVCAALVV
jgi:uncharacterized protein